MTVAAWVNLQNSGAWQQIVAKVNQVGAAVAPYFSWHLFGGPISSTQWRPQFQVVTTEGGSVNVSSTVNANYGQWVHVAGVYDGTAVRIYVNGVAQGSEAQTGNITGFSQPLFIGADGEPGEFAKGVIDEVRIYPEALSSAQVRALYSSEAQAPPAPTGLRIIASSN
jgi:hypothetical protein